MPHDHHSRENVKIAAILNICFTVVEFVGGALTNSLAIMADALHDLGDSMVLVSSWKIESLSRKKPDWQRTFGYRRLSLLAAFLNAVVLLGGSVVILFQVIGRLVNPQPVHAAGVIGLAIVGIAANTFASLRLRRGGSLNEKILSWHLLEDVLGWVGILIAGIAIYFTHWYVLDPLITIGFTAFVLWGVLRNSRELLNVFLEGAPKEKSLPAITEAVARIPGVERVYDMHIWSLDGEEYVASLKAVVTREGMHHYDITRQGIKKTLVGFDIVHATIELTEEKFYRKEDCEQEFLTPKSS